MSPTHFADRLCTEIRRKQSTVLVGLDPDWDKLPAPLQASALQRSSDETAARLWAYREFCEQIISATSDSAVAFKPQLAFFERYGSRGIAVLEEILSAHSDELFICDCKRGDIGNTSAAYAAAYFHDASSGGPPAPLQCSAVTHNAYMGWDTLEPYGPFLARDKGMFVLTKTSNPGSGDFQDLEVDGEPLYLHVARKAAQWGADFLGDSGYSSLGLVVGATFPEQARAIRAAAPQQFILVPGLETQGGKLEDARHFVGSDGLGAIFNFSRAVLYAYASGPLSGQFSPEQYAQAAGAAAELYRSRLNTALSA